MTGIEILAALGLLWGVFTYTDDQEPQCYVVTSEDPYAARWITLSEIKDGRCDFNQEVEDERN